MQTRTTRVLSPHPKTSNVQKNPCRSIGNNPRFLKHWLLPKNLGQTRESNFAVTGRGYGLVVAPLPDTPTRPTEAEVLEELAQHVQTLAGPNAVPRAEQVSAVVAMLAEGRRTLLVARTGFGKSAVYFSATKMLRDRGWGPTIVISPLLALMRDQVAAANTLGLRAVTINSSNIDSWSLIEEQINNNEIDLLLIAP